MRRTGAMQLSLPEAGDASERWLRGFSPDGGYWVDARRLADHDHSGGLQGLRVPTSSTGYWTFSTNPTVGDPSPGHVRSDTGALSTATLLVISLTTSEGTEMPGLAGTLGPGDSLYVQDRDDSTRHVRYDVTGPATNAPTHVTVPVGVAATAGAAIANNQTVAITFYLTSGGGVGGADVSITGTEGVTVAESPANTFVLGLTASPDASNTIEIRGNGIYAAAGAIPPEYVTDAELTVALGPYATDADLAAHAAAADPHPVYSTGAEVTSAITAHEALANPHAVYATDTDLATHAGAADPHTGYVLESLLDAKGDLLAASGPDAVGRLAVGTDGHVLTADSTQALGVKWAAAAGAGGAFVDEAGDTMTGTLTFQGAAVDSGGAVRVHGPGVTAVDKRVYGAGSPALPSLTIASGNTEYGVRLVPAQTMYLMAVRWYRPSTGIAAPLSVRLWDSTTPGTPVWSATTPTEWTNTLVGWKEHRLAAGTQPVLEAGRTYALSFTASSSNSQTRFSAYTPVGDAGLTFITHATGAAGAYPPTGSTFGYGIDGAFRTTLSTVSYAPAQSGAIRLSNDLGGRISWRNGADTADLALRVTGADALTFNGLVVVTQAALDALTTRVATLEAQMAGHTHTSGTIDAMGGPAVMP